MSCLWIRERVDRRVRRGVLVPVLIGGIALAACGGAEPTPDDEGGGGSGGTANGTGGSGGHSGTCELPWDCAPGALCTNSHCVSAWGRTFRFTIKEASINSPNPETGDAWDPLGGAPDPYVVVVQSDTTIYVTERDLDTFSPMWNESVDVVLQEGGPTLSFIVFDEDPVGDDEFIIGAAAEPVGWVEAVVYPPDGEIVSSDAGQFVIGIEPL